MTTPAIVCSSVTKQYEKKFALNELNLTIPHCSVAGILGPNGSGKSTLFRLLTGLVRADRGEVRVLGKPPGWKTNSEIAYLPDRARWYREHTVEQAFDYGEKFLPGFDRNLANRLASFMKIDLDARAGAMSRGQEARLMIILCIARKVPLIILDEPFSGIDAISREWIIGGLIDHMSDGEQTVLISTHETYEAEALFDHAVFMDQGQVRLQGDADELRARYGSLHSTLQNLYR